MREGIRELKQISLSLIALYYISYSDEVAEWLRRWTANPMGSARVGSNPILVGNLFSIAIHKLQNCVFVNIT
jgi:hypothetical protein